MYVCVCLNHSKSTKKKTRRAKCILGWIYCVYECPMREWRTQNESMDGQTCRRAIDQDVKIPRTRFVAPEWLILLEPILHAIHVYMQYTIHMQKGLWNLWIRNETKESSLIDTEKITILLIRRKLRWRKHLVPQIQETKMSLIILQGYKCSLQSTDGCSMLPQMTVGEVGLFLKSHRESFHLLLGVYSQREK